MRWKSGESKGHRVKNEHSVRNGIVIIAEIKKR